MRCWALVSVACALLGGASFPAQAGAQFPPSDSFWYDLNVEPKIAVENDGTAHLTWTWIGDNGNARAIRYATNASGAFLTRTLPPIPGYGHGISDEPSIAVDRFSGDVHVAWTQETVAHSTNASGSWVTESTDLTNISGASAIALGGDGRPRIAVADDYVLRVGAPCPWAGCVGPWFNPENAVTAEKYDLWGDSANNTGIEAMVVGNTATHIVGDIYPCHLAPLCAIRYSTNATGSWEFEIVEGGSQRLRGASTIVESPGGQPVIAYSRYESGVGHEGIYLATRGGPGWSIEKLLGERDYGPELAYDPSGNLHVLFLHEGTTARTLRHGVRTGGTWSFGTLSSRNTEILNSWSDARYYDLDFDAAGNLHVAVSFTNIGYAYQHGVYYGTNRGGSWRWELMAPPCTKTGTSGSNVLTGGAGDDVLCGLGGRDVLVGNGGHDWLVGGPGRDTASFAASSAGVTVRLPSGVARGAGWDLVLGIEDLRGSTRNDSFYGDGSANAFYGLGGADRLYGLGGADRLEGGPGNDTISGGGAADTLIGSSGNDAFSARDGIRDAVLGGPGRDRASADARDRLTSIEQRT